MSTTWKSSLRHSIYNLYIAEPRTSKNREKNPRKKKNRDRERNARPRSRVGSTRRHALLGRGLDLGLACARLGSRARPRPGTVRDPSRNSGRVARCLGAIWVASETQAAHRVWPAARLRPRRTLTGRGLGRTQDPVRDSSRVAWLARPKPRLGNGWPRLFPIRSESESLSLSLSVVFWKFGLYERLWLKFNLLIFCL